MGTPADSYVTQPAILLTGMDGRPLLAGHWPEIRRTLEHHFDALLAVLLALLAVGFSLQFGDWRVAALDVAACLTAALATRWTRSAGSALAIILLLLLRAPPGWPSLAEYTGLIAILGTSIRGQKRERIWMTVVYGLILAALTYQNMEGHPSWPLAIAAWAFLITATWIIGNVFATYRRALIQAQAATVQQQRLEVARELHDTVAREITRASLHTQVARDGEQSSPELDAALECLQAAATQLRSLLGALREADLSPPITTISTLADGLARAVHRLYRHGFAVDSSVEGDLNAIPDTVTPTLQAVIGEACANIERHANKARGCSIIVNVSRNAVDAAFINDVPVAEMAESSHFGVGLKGIDERLTAIGGELSTEQIGTRWISKVRIPI